MDANQCRDESAIRLWCSIQVESEKIELVEHDIDFIMAFETGGMFDRLVENGFDEDYRCGLLHLKGQPARSTRRIMKRMNEEWNLPIIVFLDGDPWSSESLQVLPMVRLRPRTFLNIWRLHPPNTLGLPLTISKRMTCPVTNSQAKM
ncbi:MAG: hypothetical protein Ct9H90mP16_15340 [Candidatus Poseidoniales archaeon]|nr:MAG: hypothetical protein Ct9H90mP16_15340 [Candidatus Poseidoniales archaeon]